MKFLVIVFFAVGMTGALAWNEASVAQQASGLKTAFGVVAIASLVLAIILGGTLS
jgi:hypothetical protein